MSPPCCPWIRSATLSAALITVVAAGGFVTAGDDPAGEDAPDVPTADRIAAGSVIAIVTHRGGFAAGLGHDHLITAPLDAARSTLVEGDPVSSRFSLQFEAERLVVDDTTQRERWSSRLMELGLLDESMEPLEDKDRRKIRRTMLGKKQLDAATHPTITVEVAHIREGVGEVGGVAFEYVLEVDFTIHGTRLRKPLAGRLATRDRCPVIEAVGPLRFSELGIRPYSAALGAVKNQDEFHAYLNLQIECDR